MKGGGLLELDAEGIRIKMARRTTDDAAGRVQATWRGRWAMGGGSTGVDGIWGWCGRVSS